MSTKSKSFNNTQSSQSEIYDRAEKLLSSKNFTRQQISEMLDVPINSVCGAVHKHLTEGTFVVLGHVLNPDSNQHVELIGRPTPTNSGQAKKPSKYIKIERADLETLIAMLTLVNA